MTIRQASMYVVMASGLLLWTGGTVLAEQSASGDKHQSDRSKGDKPGNAGADSMKQGRESGNTGVDPYGRTDAPKTGGEATLGGSGRVPDSSTNSGKGSTGGSSSGMGSGAGSMGSSGGYGK